MFVNNMNLLFQDFKHNQGVQNVDIAHLIGNKNAKFN